MLEWYKGDDLSMLISYLSDGKDIEDDVNFNGLNEILNDGPSLLSVACFFNCTDCAKFLINSGSDILKKDNRGRQPIHFAAACGNIELVKILYHTADLCFNTDILFYLTKFWCF